MVGSRFRNFRDRLLAQDQTAYLESLLVRQDKMSMAASVEARVPYVHLSVLRLANSLPHRLRIPGGVTKPLLKRVAERYLPRDLIYRRKIGLWLPLDQWLTDEGGLGRYLDDVTAADGCLAAFGDRGRLRRLVEDYRRRPGSVHPRVMFKLVNLEVWLRTLAPRAA